MRVLRGIAFDEGDADLEALVTEEGIADGGEGSKEGEEESSDDPGQISRKIRSRIARDESRQCRCGHGLVSK